MRAPEIHLVTNPSVHSSEDPWANGAVAMTGASDLPIKLEATFRVEALPHVLQDVREISEACGG